MQREHIPPSACVPNSRPEVVLTVMVWDQTWVMKMERTIINITVMGRTMKDARIMWSSFIRGERPSPGITVTNRAQRSHLASRTQLAHGNNTVLLYVLL